MRVGKWDEQKVLFKNRGQGGHDHFGGTRGAHIAAGALGTQVVNANKNLGTANLQCVSSGGNIATNVTKRRIFIGTITKYLAGTTCTIGFAGATGWTAIEYSRVNSFSGFGTFAGGAEGASIEINNFSNANGCTLFISNATIAPAAVFDVHAFVIGY